MPTIDLSVSCVPSSSMRARQVSSMFDVPPAERLSHRWQIEVPIEDRDWRVGMIVGPSGSGKSVVARHMFGDRVDVCNEWGTASVVDDIDAGVPLADLVAAFQAVGFNTIPSWLKPFSVLSNGEQFRVDLARRLIEGGDLVVVDEFTSVVDRQVAKIASHAAQRFVRRQPGRRFVAVSCHRDIVEWLRPDWTLDPSTASFDWGSVQPRPAINCEIRRVGRHEWRRFAPFHYLTAVLHRSAQCFGLFVDGVLASFAGVLHFPHWKTKNIRRVSRVVTLPDYQGIGLAFALVDRLAAAHRAAGFRFRMYPAHPPFVRSYDRSPAWSLIVRPGKRKTPARASAKGFSHGGGYRPCAVFEYVGEACAESATMLGLTCAK